MQIEAHYFCLLERERKKFQMRKEKLFLLLFAKKII